MKRLGKQTVKMQNNVYITSTSSVVGKKEGEGPLSQYFDYILEAEYWGEKTFEKTRWNSKITLLFCTKIELVILRLLDKY